MLFTHPTTLNTYIPHEVPIALREFYRVLKEDGMVVITCPDLQSVCEAVVQDKLLEPLYKSDIWSNISYRYFVWTQKRDIRRE